ncbi:OmpW family outer membrane protein [Spirosoma sp. KUDC1026]|uniref:OmpW family outer membrane protein n=1 Tax=Spirosoma sp. KUDC1026 TaxID=2745947 RepID=UPI00159BB39B|nr:OmpW family outer membrane protein [Spirosoma sp. KUDC1026]QKZ15440.1 outer membrane beta-barrel protein [Spirosoma sp. KUDC1026]
MKKLSTFLSFAVLSFISVATAQAQVNLKSISIGASYWKPSLDYWNERSFLRDYNNGQGAKLEGAVMPTAALEIGLVKGLSIGGRVGYWSKSVSSPLTIGGVNRTEDLQLSIIPASLDLKYTFGETTTTEEGAKKPFVTPYIGASVARYFISNKFNRQVTNGDGTLSQTQTGNNYGLQVFVGAERQLVKKLYLALDVRYHIGSYKQAVAEGTTSTTEKVSLNGVEAGLSLRFKLK